MNSHVAVLIWVMMMAIFVLLDRLRNAWAVQRQLRKDLDRGAQLLDLARQHPDLGVVPIDELQTELLSRVSVGAIVLVNHGDMVKAASSAACPISIKSKGAECAGCLLLSAGVVAHSISASKPNPDNHGG